MVKMSESELDETITRLIEILCKENEEVNVQSFSLAKKSISDKKKILKSLFLSWGQKPLPFDFIRLQNEFLEYENSQKKITQAFKLDFSNNMAIYSGDITTIAADAIVCPCANDFSRTIGENENSALGDIIFAGGLQIRQDLNFIKSKQGEELCGDAKIIKGYNLPSKFVICTVAPTIFAGRIGYREKEAMMGCYISALDLALSKGLKYVAFCSLGTGKKNFPKPLASEIAVSTTLLWLKDNDFPLNVIFCVRGDDTKNCYETNFADYDI